METIFEYYKKFGSADYIGEPVSQIEHMVQAAMLAEDDGQPPEVILAALFHDIGHLIQIECSETERMGKYGVKNHELIAGKFLRDLGIPEPIPSLAENHVKVKKYRTFKDPIYYEKLSEGSKKSLEFQGGPMTADEARAFEKDKLFELSLKLRDYDDGAKIKDKEIKPIEYYQEMLECLLTSR